MRQCLGEGLAHLGKRGRGRQNADERDDETVQGRDRTAGRENDGQAGDHSGPRISINLMLLAPYDS